MLIKFFCFPDKHLLLKPPPAVIPVVFIYSPELKSMRMNPWDFPLSPVTCSVSLGADRSAIVKPSTFSITGIKASFFFLLLHRQIQQQPSQHLRLDQSRMRSPSRQPAMAESIPVGRTPGKQERRQRSAACTLITQCTAERPETEGLHHVSDSLITLSGYLKDY